MTVANPSKRQLRQLRAQERLLRTPTAPPAASDVHEPLPSFEEEMPPMVEIPVEVLCTTTATDPLLIVPQDEEDWRSPLICLFEQDEEVPQTAFALALKNALGTGK